MNMITVNGNKFPAKEFDVNMICDLEDMGVSIMGGLNRTKLFPLIRGYVACCMEVDIHTAGTELQAHITKGGSLEDIADEMMKAMDESDFFRSLETTEDSQSSTGKNSKGKEVKAQ